MSVNLSYLPPELIRSISGYAGASSSRALSQTARYPRSVFSSELAGVNPEPERFEKISLLLRFIEICNNEISSIFDYLNSKKISDYTSRRFSTKVFENYDFYPIFYQIIPLSVSNDPYAPLFNVDIYEWTSLRKSDKLSTIYDIFMDSSNFPFWTRSSHNMNDMSVKRTMFDIYLAFFLSLEERTKKDDSYPRVNIESFWTNIFKLIYRALRFRDPHIVHLEREVKTVYSGIEGTYLQDGMHIQRDLEHINYLVEEIRQHYKMIEKDEVKRSYFSFRKPQKKRAKSPKKKSKPKNGKKSIKKRNYSKK
jgi:hypothetical protein